MKCQQRTIEGVVEKEQKIMKVFVSMLKSNGVKKLLGLSVEIMIELRKYTNDSAFENLKWIF